MESRKSIHIHRRLEPSLHKSPNSSSPLRRKSIIIQRQASSILSENDDEAERIARRREICTSTPMSSSSTTSHRRYSLGLGFLANIPAPQMAESINQCIKLSAENKINIKNAFSLEMIDFMTYMIKKQDDNMSNLQVASTSLDVSTKIYGFRVDSVHTEILKMVGGLDKQGHDAEQDSNEQEEALQEDAETNLKTQNKKRKKARQKVICSIESLRGNIEVIKPTSMMIGGADLQTSDVLYQAMLPNHANSGFYQHLYNDVLVDVVEQKNESELEQSGPTKYTIPAIEDFRDLEICASYSNFEFLDWSVENEPNDIRATSNVEPNETNNEFRFNLDASVEQDNDMAPEPINYFDIENDNEIAEAQGYMRTGENILDVREIAVPTGTARATESSKIGAREYSFVQLNVSLHWAGPSHWKFRNIGKPLASKSVEACMQAPLRKRREIELAYDENTQVIEAKFVLSQSNKLQAKTAKAEWSTESLTLPEDVHYDITQATKLYIHPDLCIRSQHNDEKNDTVADVSDSGRYDYNNPHDTSDYCPVLSNDNYDEGNDENECNRGCFEDDDGVLSSQALTGDNLVAMPKLANKIPIAYCLKAKKVDMRQLKNSIWTCLKIDNKVDNTSIKEMVQQAETSGMTEAKQFGNVYKTLPKVLTKSNAEALSVPLAFISLLHLANEKTLKLHSLPDMSDIIVEQD